MGLDRKTARRGVILGTVYGSDSLREKSLDVINNERKRMKMEPLVEKDRSCLRCEKVFKARGKNNHMCDNCKHKRY